MAVRATGKVQRLYVNSGNVYIRIDGTPKPLSGYFRLRQSRDNYNALYSLALSAAVNGERLQIRTTTDISPTRYGVVQYMVVDY